GEVICNNTEAYAGKQLFTCEDNYGIFVQSDKVKIGNFPERNDWEDKEE
ncbi:MAG: hypothetical protein EZS28_037440, partial [Streblomastix strix]